jgi:thiamine biosynthesis protein ThiS
MQVRVNGEPREVAEATTVTQLLQSLRIDPTLVAVELNEAVVRRAKHPETRLSEGDRVEIVTFVGGG